jgi:TonB-linked SusC/RagA family outer membrane protein
MKNMKTGLILCSILALSSTGSKAQINNDTIPVHVAFSTVEKQDLKGGISVVNLSEYMNRNYTTYSLDGMGAYTGGLTGNLWGMDGSLVLIDGVPRDAAWDISASEINQVTLLKGASAVALYGSRAAKGVILITTKRGKANENRIDIRANTGMFVPKSYPKYLGSAEYMTLYNEARVNDGLEPLYGDETIYNSLTGKNPYRYPDVDYYSSEYLKKMYNRSDVTAEISGGNERAQFYTNIGYWYANSLLDFGEAKNDRINRFNVRGNIDLKLNDFITSSVDATAIFYNSRNAHGNYWGAAANLRPNRFAPLIPIHMIEEFDDASLLLVQNSRYIIDGKYLLGGTQQDMTNPFASAYAQGYNEYAMRQFQFNAGIDADLRKVLQGLSFKTKFSVDYSNSYNQAYNNSYAVYEPVWSNYAGMDVINRLNKYNEDKSSGNQDLSGSWRQQTIAFSGQFDYVSCVNEVHNISAILAVAGFQRANSAEYHKISNANLGLQAAYNYKHKYYADFSGAVVHSAKLAPGNRDAFSPTLSLAWRLGREDFLSGSPIVDELKLTASAGILNTDLDISDYYLYKGYYTQTQGNWFGWGDGLVLTQSTNSRRGDNPNLNYAKRKEINGGFETSLFKKLLAVEMNFFVNRMDGLVIQAGTAYPGYFQTGWPESSFIPYINYNADERKGFDFNINLNKRVGQVDWTLGMAGTYFKSKAIKRDENFADAYQNRAGKPVDALFGLVSDGFYTTDEVTNRNVTQSFGEVKPGDIKYVDQNGDNIIDGKDEVFLGRAGWSGAPFNFGIHLTAKWKNFTLFALGTGNTGTYGIKSGSYYWVSGEGKYSAAVRDRWTEDTQNSATYPRLTTLNGDNNFRSSDFWLYETDRFNLSKVQLTYDIPKQILEKSFIRELSLYLSGSDLLVLSKERELMEMNVGGTPQSRFYNLGLKASF